MGATLRKCLAAAIFIAVMAAADPAYATVETAVQFVDGFGNRAIAALRGPNLSDEDREALVRDLLHQGFDVDFIGRFALGSHWPRATPAQQSDYLVLYEVYVVEIYAAWFARNTGERLTVVGARQANVKDVVVVTRIDRLNDQPIIAEWRVRAIAGRDRIIDIASNGVSLAGNHRLEFDAVIKRNGIVGLIALLRQHVAE